MPNKNGTKKIKSDVSAAGTDAYTRHLQAVAKYDKANKEKRQYYSLKLSKENDADIIERLNSVPNMQGYIKDLIRKDIG